MFLKNTQADELIDLSHVEPFKYTVDGMPVSRVEYSRNRIVIEWFTQEQLDRLRVPEELLREWYEEGLE